MSKLTDKVKEMGIPFEYEDEGSYLLFDLEDSNNFSKMFNIIDSDSNFKVADRSEATVEKARFIFTDGYVEFELNADFDNDNYECKVEER